MHARLATPAALALLLWLLPPPAGAAAVLRRSIEEMTAAASVVVRGTVRTSRAAWEGQSRIWTFTELEVTETLKGQAPTTLVVRQPGGEVGPVGQRVAGAARFAVGEDVVLFLDAPRDAKTAPLISGMAAGKVRLERGGTGELRAVRHLDGLSFHSPGERSTAGAPVQRLGRDDLGSADAFLERVRRAAKKTKGGAP